MSRLSKGLRLAVQDMVDALGVSCVLQQFATKLVGSAVERGQVGEDHRKAIFLVRRDSVHGRRVPCACMYRVVIGGMRRDS